MDCPYYGIKKYAYTFTTLYFVLDYITFESDLKN